MGSDKVPWRELPGTAKVATVAVGAIVALMALGTLLIVAGLLVRVIVWAWS